MTEKYDQVILDSPPIVAVTDAVILSTVVDATVLVVRAFKTSKDLAKHALRQLQDVSANMVGTVLNSVNLHKDEYRCSYQYYRRDRATTRTCQATTAARTAARTAAEPATRPLAWRTGDQRPMRGISAVARTGMASARPAIVGVATDISHHEHFMRSFRLTLWSFVASAAPLTGFLG